MRYEYCGRRPKLDRDCFVAPSADIIGNVEIGKGSSIWHNSVLRGDLNLIKIGEDSSVQDCSCLHVTEELPVIIGNNVTVGHSVTLHGCVIGNNSLIGMGAVVLDNAEIGENSIVAAGAVVLENAKFPPNSLIVGAPAKVKKEFEPKAIKEKLYHHAQEYKKLSETYRNAIPLD